MTKFLYYIVTSLSISSETGSPPLMISIPWLVPKQTKESLVKSVQEHLNRMSNVTRRRDKAKAVIDLFQYLEHSNLVMLFAGETIWFDHMRDKLVEFTCCPFPEMTRVQRQYLIQYHNTMYGDQSLDDGQIKYLQGMKATNTTTLWTPNTDKITTSAIETTLPYLLPRARQFFLYWIASSRLRYGRAVAATTRAVVDGKSDATELSLFTAFVQFLQQHKYDFTNHLYEGRCHRRRSLYS